MQNQFWDRKNDGGYMKALKLYIIHDTAEAALTFAFDVRVDVQSPFFNWNFAFFVLPKISLITQHCRNQEQKCREWLMSTVSQVKSYSVILWLAMLVIVAILCYTVSTLTYLYAKWIKNKEILHNHYINAVQFTLTKQFLRTEDYFQLKISY